MWNGYPLAWDFRLKAWDFSARGNAPGSSAGHAPEPWRMDRPRATASFRYLGVQRMASARVRVLVFTPKGLYSRAQGPHALACATLGYHTRTGGWRWVSECVIDAGRLSGLRVRGPRVAHASACGPWALEYNPFGVNTKTRTRAHLQSVDGPQAQKSQPFRLKTQTTRNGSTEPYKKRRYRP